MKTIITLALIIISSNTLTQNIQKYSSTVTAGAFFPLGSLDNRITSGYNIGLDLEVRNRVLAVYLNSKINFVKENSSTREFFSGSNDDTRAYNLIEINAGPRFLIGNMKELNVNIDLGFGLYTGSYFKETLWGPQFGAGFNYPVTTRFSVVLNGRLNVMGFDEGLPYIGLHSGLKYLFE
ncbi:MAG: hypothetical protein IAE93_09855 [Ignavibacteria bacterium]|nr:hypothetical protein [Ignavibacteria bacterium]